MTQCQNCEKPIKKICFCGECFKQFRRDSMSIRDMKQAIVEKAGGTASYGSSISKADMKTIYGYVIWLEKEAKQTK
jgi:hypothetical protein